jgi:hypothetical protein
MQQAARGNRMMIGAWRSIVIPDGSRSEPIRDPRTPASEKLGRGSWVPVQDYAAGSASRRRVMSGSRSIARRSARAGASGVLR